MELWRVREYNDSDMKKKNKANSLKRSKNTRLEISPKFHTELGI